MISSGRYPLIRSAPAFHVSTWPVGSSMKIAYSVTCSTSNRKRSGGTGGGSRPASAGVSARVTTPHHNLSVWRRATFHGRRGGEQKRPAAPCPRHSEFERSDTAQASAVMYRQNQQNRGASEAEPGLNARRRRNHGQPGCPGVLREQLRRRRTTRCADARVPRLVLGRARPCLEAELTLHEELEAAGERV